MSTRTVEGTNFAKVDLEEIIRGHSIGPVKFVLYRNGIAVDLTNAEIDSTFRREYANGKIVKQISETSGITITDATNGKFQFDIFAPDWTAGKYYYDVRFSLNTGEVKKYIYGYLPIKEDSTNE
jgi:hypothetical protein